MKRKVVLSLSSLSLSFILFFLACKKDDKPVDQTTSTPTTASFKFTWILGSAAEVTADDAYFVPAYSNIYASKGSDKNVNILLEDLSIGTHTIAPSKGLTLDYTSGNSTLNATSGTVVITKNSGTLLSGNYNCSVSSGGVTSTISGIFTDLPKK